MKILVTYSSLTGNTKKLAEAIHENLLQADKTILPMKEVVEVDQYDVVLAGGWADKGTFNKEANEFIAGLKNKKVGLFGTLGFWSDSDHCQNILKNVKELLDESNTFVARFMCQGPLSDQIIERFKALPEGNPHAITPEKLRRYEIGRRHPSKADMAAACELFNERLEFLNV